jgi:hypothetical protein
MLTLISAILLSFNSYAADESYIFLTCHTERNLADSSAKSYEALVIANDTEGIYKIEFYSKVGRKRTTLPSIDVKHISIGNVETLINTKTGNTVLTYKNSRSPTREGLIFIKDGNQHQRLNAVCLF